MQQAVTILLLAQFITAIGISEVGKAHGEGSPLLLEDPSKKQLSGPSRESRGPENTTGKTFKGFFHKVVDDQTTEYFLRGDNGKLYNIKIPSKLPSSSIAEFNDCLNQICEIQGDLFDKTSPQLILLKMIRSLKAHLVKVGNKAFELSSKWTVEKRGPASFKVGRSGPKSTTKLKVFESADPFPILDETAAFEKRNPKSDLYHGKGHHGSYSYKMAVYKDRTEFLIEMDGGEGLACISGIIQGENITEEMAQVRAAFGLVEETEIKR